jgi:glycosyltransferase involved in cell wall biosynthesis
MVICHITTVHKPTDVRIFEKECSWLAAQGHRVIFVVAKAESKKARGVEIIGLSDVELPRIKRFLISNLAAYRTAMAQGADIYHFHDIEFLPYAWLMRHKGRTVIYDVHEDMPRALYGRYWIPKPLRKILSRLVESFENRAAGRLSGIVTATPQINSRFARINQNVVNVNNYPSGIVDGPYVANNEICYIGGISQIRGNTELVTALGLVNRDIRLNLAGEFDPPEYRQQLEGVRGWEKVNYLGWCSRDEISRIMSRSSAGVVTFHPLPNHIDAQPNKIFEYMSAGLPLIASDFPLWRSIVEGNNCGLCVDPLDPYGLARAIEYILANPDQARKMGANGREAVKNKYNWPAEGQKLSAFYQRIGKH